MTYSTLDAGWGLIEQPDPFSKPLKFAPMTEADSGHALLGPVYVEDAKPGDLLEIILHEIRLAGWGWSCAAGWPSEFNRELSVDHAEHLIWRWKIEADRNRATNANGLEISLNPFLGWIGLAPSVPGRHTTIPPRRTGGNIDCKELVAGSRLFLPVEVEGGLLQLGDGHAVQGDGEVSGVALECPMERVQVEIRLHPAAATALPYAITPAGRLAFGFDADLTRAMYLATNGIVDFIAKARQCSRAEALLLASLKADLRVTQIVNEVKGVHALLPLVCMRELGIE